MYFSVVFQGMSEMASEGKASIPLIMQEIDPLTRETLLSSGNRQGAEGILRTADLALVSAAGATLLKEAKPILSTSIAEVCHLYIKEIFLLSKVMLD